METQADYTDRMHLFVRWDKINSANASAGAWDPDAGGKDTFGAVRLSADGTEPPSHTAASTLVTDEMKSSVLNAFADQEPYDLYLQSEGWTWQDALEDMGLQRIRPES